MERIERMLDKVFTTLIGAIRIQYLKHLLELYTVFKTLIGPGAIYSIQGHAFNSFQIPEVRRGRARLP